MTKKTTLIALILTVLIAAGVALFLSLTPDDGIMSHKGGVYTVNTTKLTPKVRGYAGTVPLEVTISGDKIQAIKALPNHETPDFFISAKNKVFAQYKGKTVKQALAAQPDVASGATYSSRAIIANVQAALKYYQKHK